MGTKDVQREKVRSHLLVERLPPSLEHPRLEQTVTMTRRPLPIPSVRCRRQWLPLILLQSLVMTVSAYERHTASATIEVQRTTASATIDVQNGDESVPTEKETPLQKKQARQHRYRLQRQQRIDTYEKRYEADWIEREENGQAYDHERPVHRQAQTGCSICYDGSSVPNPQTPSTTVQGWTCGDLEIFVSGSLEMGEVECLEFQTVGLTDCGCSVSPLDQDYCALCDPGDGSVNLIPDSYLDLPIPVTEDQPTEGLTCADLVFVKQTTGVVECDSLTTYQRYCGCPGTRPTSTSPIPSQPPMGSVGNPAPAVSPVSHAADEEPTLTPRQGGNDEDFECFMCPDQNGPRFENRKLPYLTPAPSPRSNSIPVGQPAPGQISTCGVLADQAETLNNAEQCYNYIFPEIPLDLQSYCGCASSETWDLCGLCLDRQPLANPDLNVPGTGGLTCIELQEYLRYVTDEESCSAIADAARHACCTPLPDCPVCVNKAFGYAEEKLYPPIGLQCNELSLALNENNTCTQIQQRFGWYCECPNAIKPSCSLCGKELPDKDRLIPPLGPGVTCGEVDDYASLRTEETCDAEISSWAIDVQAYCRCPGFEARNECRVQCPSDLVLSKNGRVPGSAFTCGEMVSFAPFVTDSGLCLEMQESARACCVVEDEIAGDPDGQGRVGPDGRFVPYPFLGDSDNFNVTTDKVYSREFITSPYGSVSRHNRSSATSSIVSLAVVLGLVIVSLLLLIVFCISKTGVGRGVGDKVGDKQSLL